MKTKELKKDKIPPMKRGQLNIYKPSDIKRWGVERFLDTVVIDNDSFNIVFPEFTDAENKRMDELLTQGNSGE